MKRGHGATTSLMAHGQLPMAQTSGSVFPIAEVVFNIPLERSFHYLVPPALRDNLQPGMRVRAPFGPRERTGFVVRRLAHSPFPRLKAIRRVLDTAPVIAEERWALSSWLCDYYGCSVGEALSVMVPSELRLTTASATPEAAMVKLPPSPEGSLELTTHQRQALEAILSVLAQLQPEPASGDRASRRLAQRPSTVLLHGVTGSGKTELYLRAIARALELGRSAICLIPEIALTPQTVDRFRARFGDRVVVWHSRLTARQRAHAWQRASCGLARIIVGPRSAVMSPVQRLGLIVLDEEHEPAYKQEDAPRYHARDVAHARARLTGAVVVLGSATPSVESYHAATRGRSLLVTLPQRVERRPLPSVEIVDMREEFTSRHRTGPLSNRLQQALQRTLERHEQGMLLLNRRGFARAAQCQTCGASVRCQRCSVPLIYHASRRQLICHYCNFSEAPPDMCAACRKGYLRFRGAGTERVESELHRLFPVSAIARMDRDTMTQRDSHRHVYEAVKSGAVEVLIGTQMIAKGLDFPGVTLVGVVSADTALNLPDFRAGERTFDLLTQVAGRAGRGATPGRVVIQTYCPAHYAIEAARTHDYQRFYAEEIAMRRRCHLPPFVHLIELTVLGSSGPRVEETAEVLARQLRRIRRPRISLMGPAPHRILRLRRTYRNCLVIKTHAVERTVEMLRKVLQPGRRFRGLPVLVNVDPL